MTERTAKGPLARARARSLRRTDSLETMAARRADVSDDVWDPRRDAGAVHLLLIETSVIGSHRLPLSKFPIRVVRARARASERASHRARHLPTIYTIYRVCILTDLQRDKTHRTFC